jgi:hypothetical protein
MLHVDLSSHGLDDMNNKPLRSPEVMHIVTTPHDIITWAAQGDKEMRIPIRRVASVVEK